MNSCVKGNEYGPEGGETFGSLAFSAPSICSSFPLCGRELGEKMGIVLETVQDASSLVSLLRRICI